MIRLTLALLLCLLSPYTWAQTLGPPQIVGFAFNYVHITTDATTVVKGSPGLLGNVCINNPGNGETITIYDNTAASGTVIGVITLASTSLGCFYYNVVAKTGITIVTAVATGDLTILYQ